MYLYLATLLPTPTQVEIAVRPVTVAEEAASRRLAGVVLEVTVKTETVDSANSIQLAVAAETYVTTTLVPQLNEENLDTSDVSIDAASIVVKDNEAVDEVDEVPPAVAVVKKNANVWMLLIMIVIGGSRSSLLSLDCYRQLSTFEFAIISSDFTSYLQLHALCFFLSELCRYFRRYRAAARLPPMSGPADRPASNPIDE